MSIRKGGKVIAGGVSDYNDTELRKIINEKYNETNTKMNDLRVWNRYTVDQSTSVKTFKEYVVGTKDAYTNNKVNTDGYYYEINNIIRANMSNNSEMLNNELPNYYDNQAIQYTGNLINIPKTQKFDYLSTVIKGDTLMSLVDPNKQISIDNPAILENVGQGNLVKNATYLSGGQYETATLAEIDLLPNTYYVLSIFLPKGERVYANEYIFEGAQINSAIGSNKVENVFVKTKNTLEISNRTKYPDGQWVIFKNAGTHSSSGNARDLQISYGITPQISYIPYGCTNVTICGKNLWKTLNLNTPFAITNADGSYTITPTINSNGIVIFDEVLPKGTYTFSLGLQNSIADVDVTFAADINGVAASILTMQAQNPNGLKKTITLQEKSHIIYKIWNSLKGNQFTIYPQLELGSTPTPYEPYQGQEYTIPLKDEDENAIQLRGIDTAKDNMLKDTDNLWVVKRNIGETVFDGSESGWTLGSYYSDANYAACYIKVNGKAKGFKNYITDKLPISWSVASDTHKVNAECSFGEADTNVIYICIKTSRLPSNDLAGFKAWLQVNPITVYYETTSPITITFHEGVQEILNQIKNPLDGHTIIYSTDKVAPNFECNYYKGAKNANSINGYTAERSLRTIEQHDIVAAINEVLFSSGALMRMQNIVSLTTTQNKVTFAGGDIKFFNIRTDSLEVFQNGIHLTRDVDYGITSADTIMKINGSWTGTTATPIVLEFVVHKLGPSPGGFMPT